MRITDDIGPQAVHCMNAAADRANMVLAHIDALP